MSRRVSPGQLGAAIMQYTREAPGKVYLDNIQEFAAHRFGREYADAVQTPEDIERLLNPEGGSPFLIVDGTGAVYTIPGRRQVLDPLIRASCPDYVFNRYLYEERFPDGDREVLELSDLLDRGAVRLDREKNWVNVDLTGLQSDPDRETAVGRFSLEELLRLFDKREKLPDNWEIGSFRAADTVFVDNVSLSFQQEAQSAPAFRNGVDFSGATFAGKLTMQNLHFRFITGETELDSQRIDFRNARFFHSAVFRDVTVTGDMGDMEFSFEDARLGGSLLFYGVDFGHAGLNCFQTVLGPYLIPGESPRISASSFGEQVLELKNCSFAGDSELNCEGVQIAAGKLVLDNVSGLPLARLAPDVITEKGLRRCTRCSLELWHTVIYQPLFLANFDRVHFGDVTNYGHIVAESDWAALSTEGWSLPRTLSKRKRPVSLFLQAVYAWGYEGGRAPHFTPERCVEKEAIFNMIRLDFCAQGLYDAEDQALLFYMHFKAFADSNPSRKGGAARQWGKRLLYRLLYFMGDYGLNPGKIIKTYLLVAAVFALFYFLGLCVNNEFLVFNAFSSPSVEPTVSLLLHHLWIGMLYSLECVSPFPVQCDVYSPVCAVLAALESFLGVFILGYFSFALVKRTLRN